MAKEVNWTRDLEEEMFCRHQARINIPNAWEPVGNSGWMTAWFRRDSDNQVFVVMGHAISGTMQVFSAVEEIKVHGTLR